MNNQPPYSGGRGPPGRGYPNPQFPPQSGSQPYPPRPGAYPPQSVGGMPRGFPAPRGPPTGTMTAQPPMSTPNMRGPPAPFGRGLPPPQSVGSQQQPQYPPRGQQYPPQQQQYPPRGQQPPPQQQQYPPRGQQPPPQQQQYPPRGQQPPPQQQQYPPRGQQPQYPPTQPPQYPPSQQQQQYPPPSQQPQYPQPPRGQQQQQQYGQQQQYPASQQQPRGTPRDPRQRIDPNQIPRPPIQNEVIQYHARGHTVAMPPPASSEYIAHDDGCCSPRFIRPTLNHIPATREIAKQCGIPISFIISPLATQHVEEIPVPQVNFGDEGPLRCTRCQGYINCFSKFVQGGKKYMCNICGMQNETPREYYCNTDEFGRRRDMMERPELSKGSVEFIVPEAYTVRPPQEPIYVFVIDVSIFSVQCGLLPAAINALKECLYKVPEPERARVGIITFDRHVHYYNMDAQFDTPRLLICPDINDPYAPVPPGNWLTPLEEGRDKIDAVCDLILSTYSKAEVAEVATGSALFSACEALAESGGRIMLLHTSLARIGVGKITREEVKRNYGTETERAMYTADEKDLFYAKLADTCSKRQITVDMFLCGQLFADVATVGQVCSKTGGSVHFSPYFGKNPVEDGQQLQREMERAVNRTIGFEAVLKVRCSTGLRVKDHFGHFMNRTGMDVEIAGVDSDKAIVVVLEHDDDLDEANDVFIQAALLYTTIQGQRCVRVHNLALQVAPLLTNVFRYTDLEANCAVYLRQASQWMKEKNSVKTREQLIDNCANVLFNYRKYCATASSSGQLILPESLKLLPLYTLATLKSPGVRANLTGVRGDNIDVRADERATMLMMFESLPVESAVYAVYPRLYALHNMSKECGTVGEHGEVVLPEQMPPTAERLTEDGVFLLVTAVSMYMYIAHKVPSALLVELFGSETVDSSEAPVRLVDSDAGSDLVRRIETIMDYLRERSPVKQPLQVITTKDWRCDRFTNGLIEDRTKNDMSYVEFLCQVHKKIQTRFQ